MEPKPAQAGGVPLVIGGISPNAVRRAVRYVDGWYVIGKDLDDYRAHMTLFRDECERQGRDREELEITAYWYFNVEGLVSLEVYQELGIDRLLINMHALRLGNVTEAMERFGAEVVSKYG